MRATATARRFAPPASGSSTDVGRTPLRNVSLTLAQPPGRIEDRALVCEILKLALQCRESAPQVSDALRQVAGIAADYSAIHRARRERLSESAEAALFAAVPTDLADAERVAGEQLLAEQADAARDAEDLWDQREQALAQDLAEVLGGA